MLTFHSLRDVVFQHLHRRREKVLPAARVNELVRERRVPLRLGWIDARHEPVLVRIARLAEERVPAWPSRLIWWEVRVIVPRCQVRLVIVQQYKTDAVGS